EPGATVDQAPVDREIPRPSPELGSALALRRAHDGGLSVPGPPLMSTDAAATALRDIFLANAERGDNAANDQLVADLVRRNRAQRASHESG
ncbi:MAG: hypothetical protein ACRDTH_28205, partial [Pseudonocardiaceae bacterium]